MSGPIAAFMRFVEMLDTRQERQVPDRDIREHVLSLVNKKVGVGYVRDNLEQRFGANLPLLFSDLHAVDDPEIETCDHYLLTGTIFREKTHSHKGAQKLFDRLPQGADVLYFEPTFIATTQSWSHSFKDTDASNACLGFVFDDISYYFMAEYPNRLIQKLNSDESLTGDEATRARALIARIVRERITKYNAQPMEAPRLPEGYDRRVLVVDQAYADAATVYGKVDDQSFEDMLHAALSENPDAQVIVKTHPDSSWEKDKRVGYYGHLASTGRLVVLRDPVNPYSIFELVDTVYVGTSQMGFEALMAGKTVVCFGVPFYAGWGVTDDRQPIPHRNRARSLEELFHYFYIWYSIYTVPGAQTPARLEDALDYIEQNRAFSPSLARDDVAATPKVSVIIPVHGVEPYIEECIASVQNQTLRDVEIITINDKSPDGSQAIIDRLAASDPRIKPILLEENRGQGIARNRGLDAARGDFVWLLDADDWLDRPDALERLVEAAEANGADMVRGKKSREVVYSESNEFLYDRADGTEWYFAQNIAKTTYALSPDILKNRHCWLWLYRRDWMNDHNVRFLTPKWEERAFVVNALANARAITCTTVPTTAYRIRPNSTARSRRGPADFEMMFTNFDATFRYLAEVGAMDRASPLREHLQFHMSQFVDHMMTTEPFRHFRRTGASEKAGFLARVRGFLTEYDFRPEDFDNRAAANKKPYLHARAFPLIIAALRAERTDLVETAVDLAAVAQETLYDAYLSAPKSEAERDVEAALNRYARNERSATRPGRPAKTPAKPRLIVHIGATKTGSTYLQHLMETNRPALLRQGIWYPEVGLFWQKDRPHKQAGHSAYTPEAARGGDVLRTHIDQAVGILGDKLHTIVLSSEAFFLQDDAPKIAEHFADFDIDVIMYMRRQDEWANAQYAEFVAGGAVGRIDTSFETWLALPETRRRLDYRVPLDAWAQRVGEDHVHPRVFAPEALFEGDLVADFAHATGLSVLNDLPRPDQREANAARLSRAHVELIRMFNTRAFRDRGAYFEFIETVTTGFSAWRAQAGLAMPKPWFLTPELSERILADAAQANRDVAARYLDRKEPLFADDPAQGPDETVTLHADEIAIVSDAYELAKPIEVVDPALDLDAAFANGQSHKGLKGARIVNYGHFGWRLWLLTPIVERLFVRKVIPEALGDFREEPAEFARKHWSATTPFQVGMMYPNTPALGGFAVWVPVVAAALRATGKSGQEAVFRKAPVLFMRRRPTAAGRVLGRLLFPRGELR